MYDKYIKMLDLIELSGDDELYILGDVVDRGDKPVEVLLDMMKRPNVYPIIGNHELMALNVLDMMFNGKRADVSVPVEKMIEDWLSGTGQPFRNGAHIEILMSLTADHFHGGVDDSLPCYLCFRCHGCLLSITTVI